MLGTERESHQLGTAVLQPVPGAMLFLAEPGAGRHRYQGAEEGAPALNKKSVPSRSCPPWSLLGGHAPF